MQVLERIAQGLRGAQAESKAEEVWTTDDSDDGPGCGDGQSSDEGGGTNE